MKLHSQVRVAISAFLAAGCGTQMKAPPPAAFPPLRAAEQVVGPPSVSPMPGLIVTEIEEKAVPEKLYSFSLRDADIREILMAISKQTSFNIVVNSDVEGKVTVDLKNVTLNDALDTLVDLLALTYTVKGNVIRVSKPAPETRIFSLQYVNLRRAGSSSTAAQIGAPGGTGGTVTAGAGGVSGQTTVTTTTEVDLWKDMEAGVTKLLSPAGKVVINKQSSHILVTDLPQNLDRIGAYLEKIEGSVQRQVIIEARILEVTLTGEYRFGLDWGAIAKAGALTGATTISPTRIIGQQLAPAAGDFQIGVASTDFAALLTVLSQQGEVSVLSGPKLATLNNQTAVIRAATDDVFFERRVTIIPVAGAAPQTVTEVIPRTITIGVVLSVTPQVGPNGSVVLHIRPTVTARSGERQSPEGDVFPILDVREADVVVRARDGEVVVIGGLMQERRADDERKVPLLGDIPGVGRLFRSTTQERKKTELVVLLSPTVLVGQKVRDVTAAELEKLGRLRGASPW